MPLRSTRSWTALGGTGGAACVWPARQAKPTTKASRPADSNRFMTRIPFVESVAFDGRRVCDCSEGLRRSANGANSMIWELSTGQPVDPSVQKRAVPNKRRTRRRKMAESDNGDNVRAEAQRVRDHLRAAGSAASDAIRENASAAADAARARARGAGDWAR